MKKSILYISYDGMTDPLGQSQVLPYLIGLSEKGYDIHLISCDKKNLFEKHHQKIQKLADKGNIKWYPVEYSTSPSVLGKINNLKKIKKTALDIFKNHKIEIVHCRSYMAGKVGLDLKKKFGVKFLFDMRGFWPDERVDGKVWNLNKVKDKLIYSYFKNLEKKLLKAADEIVSLTENGKKYLSEEFSQKVDKNIITVIPCCADLNHFNIKNIDAEKVLSLKKELNIGDNEIVISYLGSLGTWYMVDEMLDFFKTLNKKIPNTKFLFITKDDKEEILKLCDLKGIERNKIVITPAEREDLPSILSLSKISIFFILPMFSKRASSPTKMGEILSLGIPLIANRGVGDVDYIIEDTNCGYIIDKMNEEHFNIAIDNLKNTIELPKENLYRAAQKYYDLQSGIEKYEKIYQKLLS
jgi:glycosyltransferase involved in cell wall biosynthesis